MIAAVLITANLLSMLAISVRAFTYANFFAFPGARGLLIEALTLLALYTVIIGALFQRVQPGHGSALLRATQLGLFAALIEVLNIASERFVNPPRLWNGLLVLTFMLATFSLWGSAGYIGRRSGATTLASLALAVWSAVVTMSLGVCVGVLLELYVAPIPLAAMRFWAEFQRSGGTDLGAFAIANTMDSATSHLTMAPVVALIFGCLGTLAGRLRPPPLTDPLRSARVPT